MGPRILIPMKRLSDAKSRLSSVFRQQERIHLAAAMLLDTLDVVSACSGLAGYSLVTADPEAARCGRGAGADIIDDTAGTLNRALEAARETLFLEHGRSPLVVLPADMPLLTAGDLLALIEAHKPGVDVTIVPDHRRDGTNALVLSQDADLIFSFGPDSRRRHGELAALAGLTIQELTMPRISFDLDVAEDLDIIASQKPGRRTAKILSRRSDQDLCGGG